jgi:steroid delta-isomerase-like uncharacterized protein
MSERNKEIVRRLTEEVWNGRRLDRIPEFFAEDYVVDYRPYAPLRHGRDAVRGMVERAWEAFPDYHEELHTLVAEGNRVVAHFTCSGTQDGPWGVLPPSGKRVAFDEIVILELRDGKIVHQRGISDNLAALRQLGILPAPPDPGDG